MRNNIEIEMAWMGREGGKKGGTERGREG